MGIYKVNHSCPAARPDSVPFGIGIGAYRYEPDPLGAGQPTSLRHHFMNSSRSNPEK